MKANNYAKNNFVCGLDYINNKIYMFVALYIAV